MKDKSQMVVERERERERERESYSLKNRRIKVINKIKDSNKPVILDTG